MDRLFYIVEANQIPTIFKKGAWVTKEDLVSPTLVGSALYKKAFETENKSPIVVFEVMDPIAREEFEGQLPVDIQDLKLTNPASLGCDDPKCSSDYEMVASGKSNVSRAISKIASDHSQGQPKIYNLFRNAALKAGITIEAASTNDEADKAFGKAFAKISTEQPEKAMEFLRIYREALEQTKDSKIKYPKQAALMTAMKKIGK